MRGRKQYDAFRNTLVQANSHSLGVMKLLKEYYPAFAKKVFERNPLVEKLCLSGFFTENILDYPVCGHCETLALWNRYVKNPDGSLADDGEGNLIPVARCWKCGQDTVNPLMFFEWCMMELKKKAPESVDVELVTATDIIAERLKADADRLYMIEKAKENSNAASL